MPMQSKTELTKCLIQSQPGLVICPICGAGLSVREPSSLVCPEKHTFDLARTGYINLSYGRKRVEKYTKELFLARAAVYQKGLFAEVIRTLVLEVARTQGKGGGQIRLLDMGCGEGSHLWNTAAQLEAFGLDVFGVGIDIAKEGIQIAARNYPGMLWCVGDLAQAPFAPGQFHVLLNILSPANYREFARLLAPNGMVVKVVPGRNYLQEVRRGLYGESAGEAPQDSEAAALFKMNFAKVRTVTVHYQVDVDRQDLPALVEMTPLSWQADPSATAAFIATGPHAVTIHVEILIGERPK